MSDKLDVFEVLRRVDAFDMDYFNSLTAEQKKSLPPYVLMKWMSGCKSGLQVRLVNNNLNTYVFELGRHPDLLYKLALASSNNKPSKYSYIKNQKSKKFSNSIRVIMKRYDCSTRVARQYLDVLDSEAIVDIAEELGEQDETIKSIKKEFK